MINWQFLALNLYSITNLGFGVVTIPLIISTAGFEQYSEFAVCLSICHILTIIVSLGSETYGPGLLKSRPASSVLVAIIFIKLILALIFTFGFLVWFPKIYSNITVFLILTEIFNFQWLFVYTKNYKFYHAVAIFGRVLLIGMFTSGYLSALYYPLYLCTLTAISFSYPAYCVLKKHFELTHMLDTMKELIKLSYMYIASRLSIALRDKGAVLLIGTQFPAVFATYDIYLRVIAISNFASANYITITYHSMIQSNLLKPDNRQISILTAVILLSVSAVVGFWNFNGFSKLFEIANSVESILIICLSCALSAIYTAVGTWFLLPKENHRSFNLSTIIQAITTIAGSYIMLLIEIISVQNLLILTAIVFAQGIIIRIITYFLNGKGQKNDKKIN